MIEDQRDGDGAKVRCWSLLVRIRSGPIIPAVGGWWRKRKELDQRGEGLAEHSPDPVELLLGVAGLPVRVVDVSGVDSLLSDLIDGR